MLGEVTIKNVANQCPSVLIPGWQDSVLSFCVQHEHVLDDLRLLENLNIELLIEDCIE